MWYMPFSAARYRDITLYANVLRSAGTDNEKLLNVLNRLYEKGEITARVYVENLPTEIIENKRELLYGLKENKNDGS